MAKPIDKAYRDKMLNFIKTECSKANGPVSLSLKQLAVGVGEKATNTEKAFRTTQMLQRGGSVRIYPGQGSTPSKYEYLTDAFVTPEESPEIEEKRSNMFDVFDRADEANHAIRNFCKDLTSEMVFLKRDLEYYKGLIRNLELESTKRDGVQTFEFTGKGVDLALVIEKLRKESIE